MNKLGKMTFKLALITGILALTLLASCTTVGKALGSTLDTTTSSTSCHATGDPANPYEEITITSDISPVPASGCPTGPVLISNGRITICHATGTVTKHYDEITVSLVGLNGHGTHEGDVFPTAEGGCPTTSPVVTGSGTASNDKVTICHATGSKKNPYTEITVSVNGLNGHDKHNGDIIPAPAGGCPATK
jgi:hypothetical protein